MMMLALEGKRLLEEILEEAVMTELGEKVPTPGVNSTKNIYLTATQKIDT